MTTISLATYHAMHSKDAKQSKGKPKRPKFNNTAVEVDGMRFDSVKEYKRYIELKARSQRNEIQELKHQVKFELAPKVKIEGEKRAKPALRYFADFTYIENGVLVVEDVKSVVTRKLASYRNKKHLMKTVHKIDVREI